MRTVPSVRVAGRFFSSASALFSIAPADALRDIELRATSWPVAPGTTLSAEVGALHAAANIARLPSYLDPDSGRFVTPSWKHLERGRCCGCLCRHCPFGHAQVSPGLRQARIQTAVILRSLPLPSGCLRRPGPAYSTALLIDPSTPSLQAAKNAFKLAAAASEAPPLVVAAFDPTNYRCVWSSWPLPALADAVALLGIDLLVVPTPLPVEDHLGPAPPPSTVASAVRDALVSLGLAPASLPVRACCRDGCGSGADEEDVARRGAVSENTHPPQLNGSALACDRWCAVAESVEQAFR